MLASYLRDTKLAGAFSVEPRIDGRLFAARYGLLDSSIIPWVTNHKYNMLNYENENSVTISQHYYLWLDAPFAFTLMYKGVPISTIAFYYDPVFKFIFVEQIQGAAPDTTLTKKAARMRFKFKGKYNADSFLLDVLLLFADEIGALLVAIRQGRYNEWLRVRKKAKKGLTIYDKLANHYNFGNLGFVNALLCKLIAKKYKLPTIPHYYLAPTKHFNSASLCAFFARVWLEKRRGLQLLNTKRSRI